MIFTGLWNLPVCRAHPRVLACGGRAVVNNCIYFGVTVSVRVENITSHNINQQISLKFYSGVKARYCLWFYTHNIYSWPVRWSKTQKSIFRINFTLQIAQIQSRTVHTLASKALHLSAKGKECQDARPRGHRRPRTAALLHAVAAQSTFLCSLLGPLFLVFMIILMHEALIDEINETSQRFRSRNLESQHHNWIFLYLSFGNKEIIVYFMALDVWASHGSGRMSSYVWLFILNNNN